MKANIKRLLVLMAMLCLIASTAAAFSVDEAEGTVARIYKEMSLTQEIILESPEEGVIYHVPAFNVTGVGTGFAVGKLGEPVQYFVTNNHVISPVYDEAPCYIYDINTGKLLKTVTLPIECDKIALYIVFEDKTSMVPITVVTSTEAPDLAVVALPAPSTKRAASILRPFDINTMKKETVYALGFPAAADVFVSEDAKDNLDSTQVTRTDGLISAFVSRARSDVGELLQISAAINGGNSGGPLVDVNGYVLGVNTMSHRTAESMHAAVSVNEVVQMLDRVGITYTTVSNVSSSGSSASSGGSSLGGYVASGTDGGLGSSAASGGDSGSGGSVSFGGGSSTGGSSTGGSSSGGSSSGGGISSNTSILILAAVGVVVILLVIVLVRRRKTETITRPESEPVHSSSSRTLVCEAGALEGKRFTIKGKAVIGRDPSSCQIVLPSGTKGVSRVHCTITISNDGKAYVTDNDSSYGTWMDNTKLVPGKKTALHRGHRLYLGSRKQCFILRS